MSPDSPASLPAHPCLEQQKKRARDLQRAARSGSSEAIDRFQRHHPRLAHLPPAEVAATALRLHDAQLVIAREYGFASWPRLKQHIEATAARQHPFVRDLSYYEGRAAGLLAVHGDRAPEAMALIRKHHPRFQGCADAEIREAEFTLDDARLVHARVHGFPTWDAFLAHISAVVAGAKQEPFLEAFEALQAREFDHLEALLARDPALAAAPGTNGNTLLGLAVSLARRGGVPGPSQPVNTGERLRAVRLLLEAGADVNAGNNHGWTPLHATGYGNDPEAAELLLAAGADPSREGRGEGGTPLVAALFWGHREAAEVLGARLVTPPNLRTAAGLGRVDLAREFFTEDGIQLPEAGARRGFYRPHGGFPVWETSDHPQEILDEALVWACKSDRTEVLPFLAEWGADLNADPYRGTPLAWAAFCNRLEAARWLLTHGAHVNRRGTFGGPSHGQGITALHLAAQNGHRNMCELLLAHGADPCIQDDLYQGPAHGWARFAQHDELADFLEERARIIQP